MRLDDKLIRLSQNSERRLRERRFLCAEGVGFEPTVPFETSVFKTDAIDQLCHPSLLFSPPVGVVFLVMTIWANQFEIAEGIIFWITVFVVYLKNFFL